MNWIFTYILIIVSLFMNVQRSNAQTLNPDTLVKYCIKKIITYELDSSGQKNIQKIRIFNDEGLPIESCTYDKFFIESKLHSMFIDSVKGVYNEEGKIASYTTNRTAIMYLEGTEKINHYSFQTTYHYKRPFILLPFQKGTHVYIYTKNEEKIIKRYLKGSRDGYFKYSNNNGNTYSFEKYYPHKRKRKKGSFLRKKFEDYFNLKKSRQIKATLNSTGDVIQEEIFTTFYSRKLFIKSLEYSYTKTFTYVYTDSLMTACTTVQPNYTRTLKTKKETTKNKYKRHKKRIYFIEEHGIIDKTEIYEYITNPE